MEAIKILAGIGTPPLGKLLYYDGLGSTYRQLKLARNPSCALCGDHPSITSPISYLTPPCSMPDTITVNDLHALLATDWSGRLIDVRQPEEHAEAKIPGSELHPLPDFAASITSWDRDAEYILHCKSGMRSSKAQGIMQEKGFTNVRNTIGGIEAWKDAQLPLA